MFLSPKFEVIAGLFIELLRSLTHSQFRSVSLSCRVDLSHMKPTGIKFGSSERIYYTAAFSHTCAHTWSEIFRAGTQRSLFM